MPIALEGLDLSEYDLVISSEAGPAKGVITRPDAFHLCYCHSPMRYLWDQYHQYRTEASMPAKLAMPLMYHRLRQWDVTSSARVACRHRSSSARSTGPLPHRSHRRKEHWH